MNPRAQHIIGLPSEMLQLIFDFIPRLKDRKLLSLVCRRWNALVFDPRYLSRIVLKLPVELDSVKEAHKITRYYRSATLFCRYHINFSEQEIENLLACFERPSSSLDEVVCYDLSSNFLTLRLVSMCSFVKRVEFHFCMVDFHEDLPVLENLEALVISNASMSNIIRVAPNLRELQAGKLYFLPKVVPELPQDYLDDCSTNVTKLTTVIVDDVINQEQLEQLCKICPSLTKLRMSVTPTASLQCLASLAHLKVLSMQSHHLNFFGYNNYCLPNVEIVEFDLRAYGNMPFTTGMQRMFPNVRHLRFNDYRGENRSVPATQKVSNGFPHLRILELSRCRSAALYELLQGLTDLRELTVRGSQFFECHLPAINLHQLTLRNSELTVLDEMATVLPKLQFLNIVGKSQCHNQEKLPSNCVVRRYQPNGSDDLFDVVY